MPNHGHGQVLMQQWEHAMTEVMGQVRVFKFGGSSQGDAQRLRVVVDRVCLEAQRGPLAVVVSAMGQSTDWLLEALSLASEGRLDQAVVVARRVGALAQANLWGVLEGYRREGRRVEEVDVSALVSEFIGPLEQLLLGVSLLRESTAQSTDLVLSFGERLSAAGLSAVLRALGVPGLFVDARQWAVTDDTFGDAVIDWAATRTRLQALAPSWQDCVTVHTGFLGQTPDGRTTTLGRNGSDYTATLLGRGLDAREVVRCTDVPGVMTGDPAIIPDAYPVRHLSYLEALELSHYGARVFHARTMLPLIESGIPMFIRSTLDVDAPGTKIDATGDPGGDGPTCVASLERLSLLVVQSRALARPAKLGRRVIEALERADVTVWMSTLDAQGQSVTLVVPHEAAERAQRAIEEALEGLLGEGLVEPIEARGPVTMLSMVAERVVERDELVLRFFGALSEVGVRVLARAQGGRSRSISCVVLAEDTVLAVRTAHAAFNFSHQRVSLGILGIGVVGGCLIEQIKAQSRALLKTQDVVLDVVALARRSGAVVSHQGGLPLEAPEALFKADGPLPEGCERLGGVEADDFKVLEVLSRSPVPILVDLSDGSGHEALFEEALRRGIHVVSANKKPFAGSLQGHRRLQEASRRHHRALLYETTVGASLPVVETLKDLTRTGDRIHRIEGALSGTLGFLINETMSGKRLSVAVREAIAAGYAEPRPQDDLSGADVARKGLILARELGLEVEAAQVVVEPLVPERLLGIEGVDAFLEALESYDAVFEERVQRCRAQGRVLRYLVVIDPEGTPVVRVAPVALPLEHPATRLRGTEAFVAFTTDRFLAYPLIVQGPGAGGEVTAAGVLTDVLRVARRVRGARG